VKIAFIINPFYNNDILRTVTFYDLKFWVCKVNLSVLFFFSQLLSINFDNKGPGFKENVIIFISFQCLLINIKQVLS